MRTRLSTLRRVIREAARTPKTPAPTGLTFRAFQNDPRSIDYASLQRLSPQAAAAPGGLGHPGPTEDDIIWVARRPRDVQEPELRDWVKEEWNQLAVTYEGQPFVLFYGTMDDEYGQMWDQSKGEWISYMF